MTELIGSNAKQVEIARLRAVSLNDQESPVARIQAARKLLQDYGPSQRSLPIIRKVIKLFISSSDADVAERALKLRARLAKILDLKAVKLPAEVEEQPIDIAPDVTSLDAIAGEPEVQKLSDEWDRPAPLSHDEGLRLVEAQRPYSIYAAGEFVLRPGADTKAMIEEALDGRPLTVQTLLKLYKHMKESFGAGGLALANGPLYTELFRILNERGALQPPPPKAPDGFEPGFLDPVASVSRVTARYGSTRPKWTPLENEKLLQVALGDVPLNAHSVVQLWLSLSYDFKIRLNCVESSMLPQSLWITAAICEYVNTRHIHVPTANCFENVIEELAFRA